MEHLTPAERRELALDAFLLNALREDAKHMTPAERQQIFLDVFKRFDSVDEGARWIAQATASSVTTVMIWRCKKKTGYEIPKRPFKMLMDAMASCPTK